MPRSQPHPALRHDRDYLELVTDIVIGPAAARGAAWAVLRRHVTDYIEGFARLPVGWLNESELARRTIARRVVDRLAADSFDLLAQWRRRVLQGEDHAAFATMLHIVIRWVAIRYAHATGCDP
ncbi:MAG TPA: hypothetical protein VF516_37010 [Kofleriaceae bacterium]